MNELGVPLVKVSNYDTNDDGLVDSMHLHIELRANPQEVTNIKLIGTFDFSIKKLMQLEMIGMMIVDVDTPNGASRLVVDGELELN
jgi:hypothetical protein